MAGLYIDLRAVFCPAIMSHRIGGTLPSFIATRAFGKPAVPTAPDGEGC